MQRTPTSHPGPRAPANRVGTGDSTPITEVPADTTDALGRGFIVIPFPMSISSLRSEYQRLPAETAEPTGFPGARQPPRLPLELLDPSRPKEDLPVTSRLSPAALDLVLEEVARTLTRRQIRMVGLFATDVRDKLFLGEEIRKRVKDVQFFTYESNVLYLRPDRNRSLRGMLVFSTYPLMLDNQWATALDPQRFAFGSDLAQGVFNATLLQLGNIRAMADYRYPRGNSTVLTPPVWVTTVGNRTFLPVFRSYEELDRGYLASGCPDARTKSIANDSTTFSNCTTDPQWPRGLPFLALLTMVLASCGAGVLGFNSLRADRKLRTSLETSGITIDFQLHSLRDEVIAGSLKLHERLYAVLRVAAALGILLAASSPLLHTVKQWLPPRGAPSPLMELLAVLAAAAALCALWAVVSGALSLIRLLQYLWVPGWRYFSQKEWPSLQEKWAWRLEVVARGLVGVFGLAFLWLALGFAVDIWHLEPREFWLFYRRAIEVDSMVSPILPLVLGGVGYAVWCTWHLRRIALLRSRTIFEGLCEAEYHTPWAPRITLASALRDDLHRTADLVRSIRDRLFQVVPITGAVWVLVAFFCLGPWLWFRFGRSLEAISMSGATKLPYFDLLFRVMLMASMFATAWAAVRLLAVWDGLRHCLAGFARMPLITAFDRLPPRLARLTRLTLPGVTPAAAAGGVADLQWLHLQRIYSAKKDGFRATLSPLHADLARRLDELMKFPAERASALDTSGRRALVGRLGEVHHLLRELWRLEPMPEDVDAIADAVRKESERGDIGPVVTSMTQRIRRTHAGPVRLWLRAAEEYAASRMVEYVVWVISHLRLLSVFMLVSLLLTTSLISSYPYHPQSHLRLILLFVLVGAVGAIVVMMVQMNRNEVLSRIARTEPGKVTWDGAFVLNLFTFGVVPLLTLLSSEFPALRNALFAWVQPLVNALAKQ